MASSRRSACSSSRPARAPSSQAPVSGARREAAELIDALVRRVEAPLVLDADALFALAGRLETLSERAGPTALTPHAGELGRLLGRDSTAVGSARLASVTEAAERSGAAVLLKGPDTLVAARGEPLRVVETAVPQLATAGAGDVLAGAVGALCARGLPPAEALALAAVAHGSAARLAVADAGRDRRLGSAAAARAPARVTRSTLQVDLAAIRANARRLLAAAQRQRAVGGRQGRRLRAGRRRVRVRGARSRRRARVLCDARGGARAARRPRRRSCRSSCSRRSSRVRRRTPAGSRSSSRRWRTTRRLRAAGVSCGVHVKADTGMGRWGMAPADALATGRELAAGGGPLRLAGAMSHLATSDDDPAFAARADRGLRRVRARVPALPAPPRATPPRHWRCPRRTTTPCAAASRSTAFRRSAATRRSADCSPHCAGRAAWPRLRDARARPVGGLRPAPDRRPAPAGRLRAGRLRRRLPRLASGRAEVLVRGRRRLVAATVSMDQLTCVVDDDVQLEDEVVLIGVQGDQRITAEELAVHAETIG